MEKREIAAEIFDQDLSIHDMPKYIESLLKAVDEKAFQQGEDYTYENLNLDNPAIICANLAHTLTILDRLKNENLNDVIREISNELCTYQKPLGYDPPKQKAIWDDDKKTFVDSKTNKKLIIKKPLL